MHRDTEVFPPARVPQDDQGQEQEEKYKWSWLKCWGLPAARQGIACFHRTNVFWLSSLETHFHKTWISFVPDSVPPNMFMFIGFFTCSNYRVMGSPPVSSVAIFEIKFSICLRVLEMVWVLESQTLAQEIQKSRCLATCKLMCNSHYNNAIFDAPGLHPDNTKEERICYILRASGPLPCSFLGIRTKRPNLGGGAWGSGVGGCVLTP